MKRGISVIDKGIKRLLTASVGLLILASVFCAAVLIITLGHSNEAENIANTPSPTEEALAVGEDKRIVVIDAGHGKQSLEMTEEEKTSEGYEYNVGTDSWGEWRHYKNGTFGQDCYGDGCTGLCPENASCWYPMENGDRDIEPEINLSNALAAKTYLEQLGYEVRMTRDTNEQNPSMNKRVSYCFPNNDTSAEPDADAYICIHSNAGGGSGTSYISLNGPYEQGFIPEDYIDSSNYLGQLINERVSEKTGLYANAPIDTPYLILFNKCPVPIAYMEIGFFDNDNDLSVLRESADAIGYAIAEGVDAYFNNN